MDVFQGGVERELTPLHLVEQALETRHDARGILGGDNTLPAEHAGVGDGAEDVLPGQAPVDIDGSGIGLDDPVRGPGKAATPGLARTVHGSQDSRPRA